MFLADRGGIVKDEEEHQEQEMKVKQGRDKKKYAVEKLWGWHAGQREGQDKITTRDEQKTVSTHTIPYVGVGSRYI